ncbi:hypothetical protein [Bacillus cihuensis]|uniref:hypothetical protein n=1 Tax=Bacillus cihuensis TaxID=1208599 RepID=UPI00048E9CAE|nr:hypothetical protein [Bacillus cihuensis]
MFDTLNAESTKIIVRRLWPTMLFLAVFSLTTGIFAYYWTSKFANQIHSVVAFYGWFGACIVAFFYGIIAFNKDIKIQTANPQLQTPAEGP